MADNIVGDVETSTVGKSIDCMATATTGKLASDVLGDSLYDAIFYRRSVRKYQQDTLDESQLADILAVLNASSQILGQQARFEIVGSSEIKLSSSPYAILAYSDDSDVALCNIGYTLQGMDLYLQSIGLGSLWNGTAKPAMPSKDYRIMLNFGKTEAPRRNGAADFKRNAMSEISNEDNAIAEAARLAPSAVNFQPWYLEFSPSEVLLRRVPGGITRLLAARFQPIDLGIVLKHIELALEHEGKTVHAIEPVGSGKAFAVRLAYNEHI
jgi:hypothetical protein